MLRLSMVALTLVIACGDKDDDDDDDNDTTTDDTGTTTDDTGTTGDDTGGDDTGEEPDPIEGKIKGTVTVKLYTYDDDNELEYISWDDAFGSGAAFPFGMVYVAAYSDEGDGQEDYHGEAYIATPTTDGDEYEIELSMDMSDDVYVYAALDLWKDTIIHSWDPLGVYPDAILIEDGTEAEGVDITILVDYDAWVGGTGSGTGTGTGCDTAGVNGPVTLNFSYTSGNGSAMLVDTDGTGPHYWDIFTPTGSSDAYEMTVCQNAGDMNLLGAIDTNGNGMIDPSDTWGSYVTAPETDGNPVTIATSDLDDYEIEIPLETGGIDIVPFAMLSGAVSLDSGDTFDNELPSGTTVYVAALQYRPSSDISVSSLMSNSYDYEVFEWADLTGESSKDFSLGVPANSIVYLWAYADHDGDEVVNESGDWVASGGDDNGRLETGEGSSGNDLPLGTASE